MGKGFLSKTPRKKLTVKEKIDKLNDIEIKNFSSLKDIINTRLFAEVTPHFFPPCLHASGGRELLLNFNLAT